MKKIAVGILTIIGLTLLVPVNAQAANESIVIIDTAIDSTRKEFSGKIIQEVCVIEEGGLCPNGTGSQEGPGSATLPVDKVYKNGFEHGTIMALIANRVNPDINIIFVRIAGIKTNGSMQSFSYITVTKALDWVIRNKEKYNIVSVSASIGHHSLNSGTNYCPIRSVHNAFIANIDKLSTMNVPVMFPSGNDQRDRTRIDFPACIPQVIAVGATNTYSPGLVPTISIFTNTGPEIDFYTLGTFMTPVKNAVGTSGATAAFSAYWAKNYKGSLSETYNYFKSISRVTNNQYVKTGSFIDVLNK